jgi:hypothetical protein
VSVRFGRSPRHAKRGGDGGTKPGPGRRGGMVLWNVTWLLLLCVVIAKAGKPQTDSCYWGNRSSSAPQWLVVASPGRLLMTVGRGALESLKSVKRSRTLQAPACPNKGDRSCSF